MAARTAGIDRNEEITSLATYVYVRRRHPAGVTLRRQQTQRYARHVLDHADWFTFNWTSCMHARRLLLRNTLRAGVETYEDLNILSRQLQRLSH